MALDGATIQVGAGLLSLAIAAGFFVLRPGRGPTRIFALILALSGGRLATAGWTLLSASPELPARLHPYYTIALPFATAYFALTYPAPRVRSTRTTALLLTGGAIAGIAIYVAWPPAYWDVGTLAPGMEPYYAPEVAKGPLIIFHRLVELAAGVAALLFARDYLRSETPARRSSLLFVSAGFSYPQRARARS